jgi:hypothetical protein
MKTIYQRLSEYLRCQSQWPCQQLLAALRHVSMPRMLAQDSNQQRDNDVLVSTTTFDLRITLLKLIPKIPIFVIFRGSWHMRALWIL